MTPKQTRRTRRCTGASSHFSQSSTSRIRASRSRTIATSTPSASVAGPSSHHMSLRSTTNPPFPTTENNMNDLDAGFESEDEVMTKGSDTNPFIRGSSVQAPPQSMRTPSLSGDTMSTPSDSLDHPNMTGGAEPPAKSRRTLKPESAGPAEIVANFQFTYSEQQCDLELLQWMFSDGSPVPRQGNRVENLLTSLKWPTLSQKENHRRRLRTCA